MISEEEVRALKTALLHAGTLDDLRGNLVALELRLIESDG